MNDKVGVLKFVGKGFSLCVIIGERQLVTVGIDIPNDDGLVNKERLKRSGHKELGGK